MGRLFTVSLEGKIYTCKYCGTHLALHEDIASTSFMTRHGEACLFKKVVNVTRGKLLGSTRRRLYNVAVIFCVGCEAMMGSIYIEVVVSGSGKTVPILIMRWMMLEQ